MLKLNKGVGGMICVKNITKTYGDKKVIDDISLDIKDGEIFGFLGHNGAGKTTTIKMITGITKQNSGTIEINGIDVLENSIESKKQFGYVSDSPDMFLRLKGIEYLNFIADIYGVSEEDRKERIKNYANQLEMSQALGDKIQSYSHGMRQKIVLIGALIHDPSVWILDEPLTGLDPKSSYILKEMMREHADKGNTVFFSTHVLEVAEKICDRVAIINKGKIIFCGTLEEMKQHFKNNSSLEKMFLEMTNNE